MVLKNLSLEKHYENKKCIGCDTTITEKNFAKGRIKNIVVKEERQTMVDVICKSCDAEGCDWGIKPQ